MTTSAIKKIIIDKLELVLPPLFLAASPSLDDFEKYLYTPPDETEARQLGIYKMGESWNDSIHTLSLIIQAQLYKKPDWNQDYDSVMMPAIIKYITPELVGFTSRDFENDCFPLERTSSTINFYPLTFTRELDDCD